MSEKQSFHTSSAAWRARGGVACPYCGFPLAIAQLPIVATQFAASGQQGRGEGGLFDGLEAEPAGTATNRPRSGSEVLGWIGKWPILVDGYAPPKQGLSRLIRSRQPTVPPASTLAPLVDRPARACLHCEQPLPEGVENGYFMVAVVGINQASKSHFIATALHEAYYDQGLAPYGFTTFEPEGETADTFYRQYERPLYEEHRALEFTQKDDPVVPTRRFRPLVFRARSRTHGQFPVIVHDIAGENLANYADRLSVAPFLQRADAIVFVLDPRWLPKIRHRLSHHAQGAPDYDQIALFGQVLEELDDPDSVPNALAVSKSDLLAEALPGAWHFLDEPPVDPKGRLADLTLVDAEVRQALAQAGAAPLLSKLTDHPRITCHAIAPLGKPQSSDGTVDRLDPQRVLDPMLAVLAGAGLLEL